MTVLYKQQIITKVQQSAPGCLKMSTNGVILLLTTLWTVSKNLYNVNNECNDFHIYGKAK